MSTLRFYTWRYKLDALKSTIIETKDQTLAIFRRELLLKPGSEYTLDKTWQPTRLRRLYHFYRPAPIYKEMRAVQAYVAVNKFDLNVAKIRLACFILLSPSIMFFPILYARPHKVIVPDWLRYYLFDEEEYVQMHMEHLKYIEQCYNDYDEEEKLRKATN